MSDDPQAAGRTGAPIPAPPVEDATRTDAVSDALEAAARAEEALRWSEARLRQALAAGHLGVWWFDPASNQTRLDPCARELFGFEDEVVSADAIDLRIHPADLDAFVAARDAALAPTGPDVFSLTHRILRPDGELRWVEGQAHIFFEGTAPERVPVRAVGVVRDVTQQKRAEAALRESEARYRLLAEHATEYALLMLDPEGIVTLWNRGAERLFGFSEAEALGRPWAVVFTEADRARGEPAADLQDAHATARAAAERWFRRKDGTLFWGTGVVATVRDAEGRRQGYTVVLRDNTARKQAADSIRELNRTLEERVATRTRQVQDLAHRLTMAEQGERRRLSQILHDDLQQMLYGVELRMAAVAKDLRNHDLEELADELEGAGRWVEEAVATTRRLAVDLSPPILSREGLVDSFKWLQRQMRELHGLDVHIEAAHAYQIADEDLRVLLFQVVRELLFNVTKHAGTDQVTVALDETDVAGAGRRLVIHVVDHGVGFDSAAFPRGGSQHGLGLVHVRERVSLLGGDVRVRSSPGAGTHVEVVAPLIRAGVNPLLFEPQGATDRWAGSHAPEA